MVNNLTIWSLNSDYIVASPSSSLYLPLTLFNRWLSPLNQFIYLIATLIFHLDALFFPPSCFISLARFFSKFLLTVILSFFLFLSYSALLFSLSFFFFFEGEILTLNWSIFSPSNHFSTQCLFFFCRRSLSLSHDILSLLDTLFSFIPVSIFLSATLFHNLEFLFCLFRMVSFSSTWSPSFFLPWQTPLFLLSNSLSSLVASFLCYSLFLQFFSLHLTLLLFLVQSFSPLSLSLSLAHCFLLLFLASKCICPITFLPSETF